MAAAKQNRCLRDVESVLKLYRSPVRATRQGSIQNLQPASPYCGPTPVERNLFQAYSRPILALFGLQAVGEQFHDSDGGG